MFIAIDGDDVGRRFEERLAECTGTQEAIALHQWSQRVQQELSQLMTTLGDSWSGSFLARTGDGFLASLSDSHFADLTQNFRPRLTDASVTTGIGLTVKRRLHRPENRQSEESWRRDILLSKST